MFITVPFKNQAKKKIIKKHQDSIFKQIQHSNVIDKLSRDQILKRSSLLQINNIYQNGKKPERLSWITKSQSSSFFRPRSSHQSKNLDQIQENIRQKPSKTRCSIRKYKSTTLFDLQIKQMKNIITKFHKETIDQMNQKDRKKITKNGWFLIDNDSKTKNSNISGKVTQVKKRLKKKIRDDKNNIFVQNSITAQNSPYCSILHSPRQQKVQLQSEQIQRFYNFARGGLEQNQYSSAISLKQYQKSKASFYILQNMQEKVKNGKQFKKISLQNFGIYKRGKVMPFVYLKQNKFKKCSAKEKQLFVTNNIVQ